MLVSQTKTSRLTSISSFLCLFKGEPIVSHDLLAALANLMPGESHELHPPSTEYPGIVIHTAKVKDETDDTNENEQCQSNRVIHTRCPDRT